MVYDSVDDTYRLRLEPGEFAYQIVAAQSVPAADSNTATAVLQSEVEVGEPAWVTLMEGPPLSMSFNQRLNRGGAVFPDSWNWSITEKPSSGPETSLVLALNDKWTSPVTGTVVIPGSSGPPQIDLDSSLGGYNNLRVTWEVHSTAGPGTVRIALRLALRRPYGAHGAIHLDVKHLISGAPNVNLGSFSIPYDERNGLVVLDELDVDVGDRVRFELSQGCPCGGSHPNPEIRFTPTITYVGRRLTYVYNATPPTSTSTHVFLAGSAPVGGISTEAAGADWLTAFASNPDPSPRAPLQVELRNPQGQSTPVDFDNISLKLDWTDITSTQATALALRDDIVDEATWVNENYLDLRSANHPYACQAGLKLDGTTNSLTYGVVPAFLAPYLTQIFDPCGFEDLLWVREHELDMTRTADNMMHFYWSCASSQYLEIGTGTPPADPPPAMETVALESIVDSWLDRYERMGDVPSLDLAVDYCQKMLDPTTGGIVGSAPPYAQHEGMIRPVGYRWDTGEFDPTDQDALDDFHDNGSKGVDFMRAPAAILATYSAARKFNDAHSGFPERYDSTNLDSWLPLVKTAIAKAVEQRAGDLDPQIQAGVLRGNWWKYHGEFNDFYGYQSSDAQQADEALADFTTPATVGEIRDLLLRENQTWDPDAVVGNDDIIRDGGLFYWRAWTQSIGRASYNAGDQPRAWGAYVKMANDARTLDSDEKEAFATQLREAAFYIQKTMLDDGVWSEAPATWFQRPDLSKALLSGPNHGVNAVTEILGLDASLLPNPEEYLATAAAIIRTTQEYWTARVAGDERGYWPKWEEVGQSLTQPAGFERRSAENFINLLPTIYEVAQVDAAPRVTITPGHLASIATGFTVRITLDDATSAAELQDALDDRTLVYLWSGRNGQRLWGSAPNCHFGISHTTANLSWTQAIDSSANPKWIELTLSNPPQGFIGSPSKVVVASWDEFGRADIQTSYRD